MHQAPLTGMLKEYIWHRTLKERRRVGMPVADAPAVCAISCSPTAAADTAAVGYLKADKGHVGLLDLRAGGLRALCEAANANDYLQSVVLSPDGRRALVQHAAAMPSAAMNAA